MYSKRGCYEVVSRPLTPSGLVVRAVVANWVGFGVWKTCIGNTSQSLPSCVDVVQVA